MGLSAARTIASLTNDTVGDPPQKSAPGFASAADFQQPSAENVKKEKAASGLAGGPDALKAKRLMQR